ncbi:cyclic peptide export ABC transporter [Roseivirga sp. BDSF3-8]|uniref:cyclic peptide export ABC transporter n=1 Tax=Roseivirga sp. BDSF3-8 TaxID=3241598 RepID=UPI0035322FAC
MLSILQVFQQKSRYFYVFLILLGGISSLLYSGILFFINNAIGAKTFPFLHDKVAEYDWAIFIALVILSLVIGRIFQTYIVRLTNDFLLIFELTVLNRVRFATFQAYAKVGEQRIYTAIQDVKVLGQFPATFVNGFNNAIILVCGLIYLFIIAPLGGVAILSVMLILLAVYLIRNKAIDRDLNTLRDLHNDYYRYLRDLLGGFKEVKMSIDRNDNMYEGYLKRNLSESKDLNVSASVKYVDNELFGSFSWYVVLGTIIFALPRLLEYTNAQVASLVVVILFLMGPVATMISLVPFATRYNIAYQRLRGLERDINAAFYGKLAHGDRTDINQDFHSIRFDGVEFEYKDAQKDTIFKLGPIDLEVRQGEVIFITGGNGSGKSTFLNLLTGLIRPTAGRIYLNNHEISEERYPYYSNQISAIFTNPHLFGENYDRFPIHSGNEVLQQFIQKMELNGIVRIDDDRSYIDGNLSRGQQKRLAMIFTMMEQRDVIVLDEWAAEQDPEFRAFFYNHLLDDFKKAGKTILAVTHDDAYFDKADRRIRFDFGKVVLDEKLDGSKAVTSL